MTTATVKRPIRKPVPKAALPQITPSSLKVFDIPLELLEGDEQNPNEMSEGKFDELVESIRSDGFDEPIQVIPHPHKEGYYLISGGHHRTKAARKVGMKAVPAVIKNEWSEDQSKFALVKRNILHGKMNGAKFTQLYNDLAKRYDPKLLQTMLGFTETKEFDAIYDGVLKTMAPKQRAQLAKAKEKIKSVDDLSSVLNTIFKEAGSDIQEGYVVFSFGGKHHHYVQIDDATNKKLMAAKKKFEADGVSFRDALQSIIANGLADIRVTPPTPRKLRRIKK